MTKNRSSRPRIVDAAIRRRLCGAIAALPAALAIPSAAIAECFGAKPDGEGESIRALAKRKGIHFGVAVSSDQLVRDPVYARLLLAECAHLVPEWEMKWRTIWRDRYRPDYAGLDLIAQFCRKNCLSMRGHPLVWHAAMPDWATTDPTRGLSLALLEAHMAALMNRYGGLTISWDVVNEAIRFEDGNPQALRSSPWLTAFGPSYIEHAFKTARRLSPHARLVYNDYNIEYDNKKAKKIIDLVKRLRDADVPIDAVGLQSHLWASRKIDKIALSKFCRDAAREGLDVVITELDIRETDFRADIRARDTRVHDALVAYLETVLVEITPSELTLWGLSDRYSWLSKPAYNPENPAGYTNRGLPYDIGLNRKQLWTALFQKISELPNILPRETAQ